jgi:hypothetical protein
MKEVYPKIAVDRICVADVSFRKIDSMFNVGQVILDVDTYDFAGHLTDDVIVGFYRNGTYSIYYYYNYMQLLIGGEDLQTIQKRMMLGYDGYFIQDEIALTAKLKIDSLNFFVNKNISFRERYRLDFNQLTVESKKVEYVFNLNRDLLTLRI